MENWKLIDEDSKYEVNKEGQVRNVKTGRLLKPFLSYNGYLRVSLGGKNRMIHRLVALAFLPNPDGYPFVNHKFIQEFPSIKAAAQAINAKNDSGIGLCCRGKYKYAMGYIWRYKNRVELVTLP